MKNKDENKVTNKLKKVVSFDIVSLNQEGELIINFDDVPNT